MFFTRPRAGASFGLYTFGVLWGLGGLTFGLTMRYLGMSLGMAVALGYTAAFGTLMPPIFRGQFRDRGSGNEVGFDDSDRSGNLFARDCFCRHGGNVERKGIVRGAEARLPSKNSISRRGSWWLRFSGVMSACFAYGLAAGDPVKELTIRHGTPVLWQGLPVLVVVLLGGFTTNIVWCVILNVRNRTGYQYFNSNVRGPVPLRSNEPILENPIDAPAEENGRNWPAVKNPIS